MRAFELLCCLVVFMRISDCLNIVEDFRVKSISKSSLSTASENNNKVNIAIGDIEGGASTTTVQTASVLSTVSSSAPTITLSNTMQFVYTDDTNSYYYIEMAIQDTETAYNQTFPFLLDTGSSLCWVYNSSCLENGCKSTGVKKFSDSKKLTPSSSFDLAYSGDYVSGELINLRQNNLSISVDNLLLEDFTLGITEDSPSTFDNLNISGLIGISSSTNNNENWIYQLYKDDIMDYPAFGFCLLNASHINYVSSKDQNIDLPSGYGGLLILGSDAENYTDKITYSDIIENDNSYWLLNITDIQVYNGSTSSDFNDTVNYRNAIIDTGTTGIALPLSDAEELMLKAFGTDLITDGKGNFAFPCSSIDNKIILTIGGEEFNILSQYIMGAEYTSSSLSGYCASKLQGYNSSYWVLGATFLKNYYTIFDLEKNRVGLGNFNFDSFKLVEESSNSSSTTKSKITTASNLMSWTQISSQSTATSNNSSSQSTSSLLNAGITLSSEVLSQNSIIIYLSICLLAIF